MSNNPAPFAYLPLEFRENLGYHKSSDLTFIRLLPAVWNNNNIPNWKNVETEYQRAYITDQIKDYYRETIATAYKDKIATNQNINQYNRTLIAELLRCYYKHTITPALFGVYLDGNALINKISKINDNEEIRKITTRYFDAMSTAVVFGVLSANNNKLNGKLNSEVARAKNLFLDLYDLPLSADFDPLSSQLQLAEEAGLPGQPYMVPIGQIKTEITQDLGLDNPAKLSFVKDMTGSAKDEYKNEEKDKQGKYEEAIRWLNKYDFYLTDTKEVERKKAALN